VAIDVAYAGINFIDVMARRGDPGYADAWPYVPGLEVAGSIVSVGSGVHGLHAGNRVAAFTPGGDMAEVAIAAAGQIRPQLTAIETLESVAAIQDLLAAGQGSGKYVTKVHG
jgi:NADPH:quinone reductase